MSPKPNHVHLHGGVVSDHTFGAGFGHLLSCKPVVITGLGHIPHIEAKFQHGIRLEFDRATASEFARALTECVGALPVAVNGADVSGSVCDMGVEDA